MYMNQPHPLCVDKRKWLLEVLTFDWKKHLGYKLTEIWVIREWKSRGVMYLICVTLNLFLWSICACQCGIYIFTAMPALLLILNRSSLVRGMVHYGAFQFFFLQQAIGGTVDQFPKGSCSCCKWHCIRIWHSTPQFVWHSVCQQ